MENKSPSSEFYKPSWIHAFISWIDRLPGPYWLYYLGIIPIAGLLNHIVAWNEKLLAFGEVNTYYALTAFFLAFYLFEIDFLLRVTQDTLIEFLPILDVPEGECDRIMFEFTHLPARQTAIAFWLGAIIGLGLGLMIFPTALEMNNAFPELELPIFTISFGVGYIVLYMVIRAFILINRVYAGLKSISFYDLNSLYAMSRYSAWLLIFVVLHAYLLFALNPSLVDFTFYYLLSIVTGITVIVLSIFWFPVRRVNRIMVLEKKRLLKDVNLRIETTFNLLHVRIDQQEFRNIVELRETLQSLMIEKDFIDSLRTWPWKPSTLTGLLSVVVFPLFVGLLLEIASKFIAR